MRGLAHARRDEARLVRDDDRLRSIAGAELAQLGASLAVHQTVRRSDNIPIGPGAGLLVVATYGAVALVVALWLIGRRDA